MPSTTSLMLRAPWARLEARTEADAALIRSMLAAILARCAGLVGNLPIRPWSTTLECESF